ncbi:kinase-like domain-containing protein, partial [Vararia minispora EC-137]
MIGNPVLQIAPAVNVLPPGHPGSEEDEVRLTFEVRHAGVHEGPGSKQEYILNQYKRGDQIGKGQHGQVYVCYDMAKEGNPKRAMKVVNRKNPRQDRVKELRKHKLPQSGNHIPVTENFSSTEHKIKKEIAVMKNCRHPHVVRLIEVIDDPLYKKVYMIMEYLAGGEVKWRDENKNPILTVDQIRRICRDVILGLEYLHQQGIIHRDIKPANLLWTEDRRMVKITDFGVAWMSVAHAARSEPHQRTESSYDNLRHLFDESELCKTAGTPSFLAPEVVHEYGSNDLSSETSQASLTDTARVNANGESTTTVQQAPSSRPPITKAVDIWALGVTLYGMLFGVVPFHADGAHEYMIYHMICTEDWDVPPTMGLDRIPTGGRHPDLSVPEPTEGALVISLLDRLLEKDASKRATLAEVKV